MTTWLSPEQQSATLAVGALQEQLAAAREAIEQTETMAHLLDSCVSELEGLTKGPGPDLEKELVMNLLPFAKSHAAI
eukprot:10526952-Karenia_brevis.AAC.1